MTLCVDNHAYLSRSGPEADVQNNISSLLLIFHLSCLLTVAGNLGSNEQKKEETTRQTYVIFVKYCSFSILINKRTVILKSIILYIRVLQHTGCKSDIWKKVQVNIQCIYIDSIETNDTSAESP